LSESVILLCCPQLGVEASTKNEELLRATLPNAKKFVLSEGKSEFPEGTKAFKVDRDYPAALPFLQTLARWAECFDASEPRLRDGYDLYGLTEIIEQNAKAGYALLLRDATGIADQWQSLLTQVRGQIFVSFGEEGGVDPDVTARRNVLIDLKDARAPEFLKHALQLYLTGAVYSLVPYSIETALSIVRDGLRMSAQINRELV
jgi:hypothetical protein